MRRCELRMAHYVDGFFSVGRNTRYVLPDEYINRTGNGTPLRHNHFLVLVELSQLAKEPVPRLVIDSLEHRLSKRLNFTPNLSLRA